MRKFIFLYTCSLFISVYVMAQAVAPQKDYTISAGVDMAYAVGRFHFAHRLGYGISVQGEYLFADNASVTLNTGYINFQARAIKDSVSSDILTEQLLDFSMVPFLLGMKIDNEGKYYIHPQFGIAFRSKPFVSALYAFGVGMRASKHADISLRYEAVQKKSVVASFFAVRFDYVF